MDRKRLITIHMYLAAFFAPAVLLVAISGGLYLVGFKGKVEQEAIYSSSNATIDSKSASLDTDVAELLADAGVESYSFESVKASGATLYTRPSSSDHYIIKLSESGVEVIHARPSLQGRMIELHKGHGPSAFKTFQKAFAIGLVFIILSGLWLGISAARLRRSTLLTATAGAVVFALLLI
ncbi:PepSY-associated TM helix domain-containing protein [Pseudomonadota bacterium]